MIVIRPTWELCDRELSDGWHLRQVKIQKRSRSF